MDVDETTKTITELGVCIEDFISDKPKTKAKCHNGKLKIFREFVLATISALAEIKSINVHTKTDKELLAQPQVYALDALACTGIAGIQWKKHLLSRVHVTLVDHDGTEKIVANAQANQLNCTELKLNPLRVPGDLVDIQSEKEVHYCQADAKAVMMMESYNFIYLSSNKTCASYFEPALHSMRSEGVLCVVIPDISLFARSPHVVQRFYAADVVKTEYLKELAARIVLASLARAAARCLKGISPQYVVSHEDHLLICVKVSRGHNAADSSVNGIEKLLHCRLCEERIFMPNQLAPNDDPYSLLPCACKKNNPGKTAVILGPVWKGHISDPDFLSHLQKQAKQMSLSTKFFELINLLIKENLCAKSDTIPPVGPSSQPDLVTAENKNAINLHVCSSSDTVENTSVVTTNTAENASVITTDTVENASVITTDTIENASVVTTNTVENTNVISTNTVENTSIITTNTVENTSVITTDTVENTRVITTSGCGSNDKLVKPDQVEQPQEVTNGIDHAKEDLQEQTDKSSTMQKRKAEFDVNNTKSKRQRKEESTTKSANVAFYYNVTKFRKTNLPKLDKLVTILHCHGHRASRTHFDSCAIRTSATVNEFLHIFG